MALASARRFAEAEGLRGVGARRIARDIGYTIGTIYNVFEDLDDLVLKLNGRTLDELYAAASAAPPGEGPVGRLKGLAASYLAYIDAHPKLWATLFDFTLPKGKAAPDWYDARVARLFGLIEQAIAPLFKPGEEASQRHHARVMWASLHGILSLGASGKLASGETVNAMAGDLIENYVAGLRARQAGRTA